MNSQETRRNTNNPNNHWRGVKRYIYFPIFDRYEHKIDKCRKD